MLDIIWGIIAKDSNLVHKTKKNYAYMLLVSVLYQSKCKTNLFKFINK